MVLRLSRLLVYVIFAVYAVFVLLTYFDYIEGYLYPLHALRGDIQQLNEHVLLGPYPHFNELQTLRDKAGVTEVISLLNDDLPQEKALLNREQKVASMLGIKLYSYPMAYLDLKSRSNARVAEEIAALLRGLNGSKVYIHCYLGRHRVNIVKDAIQQKVSGL